MFIYETFLEVSGALGRATALGGILPRLRHAVLLRRRIGGEDRRAEAGVVADILFRMLQPHELAAAMGFPAGYKFCGNREDVVKQIGNAVEVNKAFAHLMELSYLVAA
jgi:site-specific DNA-cytosine methylase